MAERGVVCFETFSGVTLLVTPLSVATIQAIVARSKAEYPDIDDTPYRVEIPHSAVPGQTILDEENPEYQKLLVELHTKRDAFTNRLFFELGTELADKKADVLKAHKERIQQLRAALALVDETDEFILLFHIALARTEDATAITNIIRDRVPLTEGEVADGLKIFRPELPGHGLLGTAQKSSRLHPRTEPQQGNVVEPGI